MPVHHDDEYRIGVEKDELLRRLGIGVDSEEHRQMSLSPTIEKSGHDQDRGPASRSADWLGGGIGTSIIGLLRVLVLQNELVLYALTRLEEAGAARPRAFNPADWK